MTIQVLEPLPASLNALPNPPKRLFFKGDANLLSHKKVAIVGTRAPNPYTKNLTALLASRIARFAAIVSGGALGTDCVAHRGGFPHTIMVSPSGLNIPYPRENAKLIEAIGREALILSEYESDFMPRKESFLERNRLVIALSDLVILPQGDLKSGTSASARIALELGKPIFTLPQRYGESPLTTALLAQNKAKAIYDIDDFLGEIFGAAAGKNALENAWANLAANPRGGGESSRRESGESCAESSRESAAQRDPQNAPNDSQNPARDPQIEEILGFCKAPQNFENAYAKFGAKLLECEFLGLLVRENNTIRTK